MSNKNLITHNLENFLNGYFIYVNSLHTSFKSHYKLNGTDFTVFVHFLSTNKMKKLQSASKIASLIYEDKRAVSESIKKLKGIGLLFETKINYHFSIFNAQLPFRFKSSNISDNMTGSKKNIILKKFLKFESVQNCTDQYFSRYIFVPIIFKSVHNCTDCGHKVNLKRKLIKEKVKQHSFLSESEIRGELLLKYGCNDQELDLAFRYKEKHDNITTPHNLFYKSIQVQEFKIILEKANREHTLECENKAILKNEDLSGVDLKSIYQQASKWNSEHPDNVFFLNDESQSITYENHIAIGLNDMIRHLEKSVTMAS